MESTIRGILEKEIELATSVESLGIMFERVKGLTTKNFEDCMFGLVVGYIFGRFLTFVQPKTRLNISIDDNAREFWDMIEKRTNYIRGRIKLALGK